LIVLDTNVVSELRLPNPDSNVTAWFGVQQEKDLAVASFSIAEIEYGIALVRHRGVLAEHLTGWLVRFWQRSTSCRSTNSARILGQLHSIPALRHLITAPARARRPRFAEDLAIAATAPPSRIGSHAQPGGLSLDRDPLPWVGRHESVDGRDILTILPCRPTGLVAEATRQ
jgi:predicted nucleic acid-binding protein